MRRNLIIISVIALIAIGIAARVASDKNGTKLQGDSQPIANANSLPENFPKPSATPIATATLSQKPSPTPVKNFINGTYTLPLYGKLDIDGRYYLQFAGVKEDSRCPQGVQCIQAGQAIVSISFIDRDRGGNVYTEQFKVGAEPGDFPMGDKVYSISASDLLPHPQNNVEVKSSDYKVILDIKKISN